jgi:hypothetical protein
MSTVNETSTLDTGQKELPRWVQVLTGLILGLFALLCALASADMLFAPNKKSAILAITAGLPLLLGSLWVLGKCFRLITGRKNRSGLMSPTALRVVAFVCLVLPFAGLFTGSYRKMGAIAIFQALVYFTIFRGLRALARQREAAEISDQQMRQINGTEVVERSEKPCND